ncbi:hypothetical protein Q4485_05930 [Granulosicoccaceae sp. 1_MG-2023]|nr:hypothetical protein [Granulosicoccaceae sp. 1_MG-2023]
MAVLLITPGLVFSPVLLAQQSPFVADFDPPVIDHQAPDGIQASGAQAITATVTDDVGVGSVMLKYRPIGTDNYKSVTMTLLGGSGVYMVTLPAAEAASPGIEYYIEARDVSGNTVLKGFPISPLKLSVAEPAAPLVQSGPSVVATPVAQSETEADSGSGRKWLWIGLGVLALGGLAAAAGGGGGSDGGGTDNVDLTITANPPE